MVRLAINNKAIRKRNIMIEKLKRIMTERVKLMQVLEVVDKESTTEELVDVLMKVYYEQEDKNLLTDSLIDYNDEIISIENVGDCETIDISVTGDSLFFCNDILTKNSIGLAATADVIVSIFQNPEDQELGVIRLGMMKNRYGSRGHTQPMRIDYTTLTVTQADDLVSLDDEDDTYNALSAFAR